MFKFLGRTSTLAVLSGVIGALVIGSLWGFNMPREVQLQMYGTGFGFGAASMFLITWQHSWHWILVGLFLVLVACIAPFLMAGKPIIQIIWDYIIIVRQADVVNVGMVGFGLLSAAFIKFAVDSASPTQTVAAE